MLYKSNSNSTASISGNNFCKFGLGRSDLTRSRTVGWLDPMKQCVELRWKWKESVRMNQYIWSFFFKIAREIRHDGKFCCRGLALICASIYSASLYPSFCWNELREGIGWWHPGPSTRQCFLRAAATVIFGRFWSFFLQKAHAAYIADAEGKNWGANIILTLLDRVVFKGGVIFPELRATFQN